MGNVSISGAGGAGAGSDECTSTKAEVLKGYTAITGDSNDEVVVGTLELTGDAADSQVLAGMSFYKTNPKDKRTGTMTNRGAASAVLNAGESYSIPAGYHNGGGKVTANSLANQTPGNATANKIISGYSAYVNGVRVDGTLGVQSILSFNAAVYSSTAIMLNWQNPTIGPFAGIRVVYKTGGYPTSMYDGTLCYQGPGNNYNPLGTSSALVDGFSPGVTYYFRACGFSTQAGSLWLNNSTFTAGVSTTRGQQVFTDSGVFIVPDGVRSIDVFCVGGGASGGYGVSSSSYAMRGGSSGRTATAKGINVSPGQQFAVTIGAGGPGDKSLVYSGNATSFGNNLVTAAGGVRYGVSTVGNGGSGEGVGYNFNHDSGDYDFHSSRGGSDGSDGETSWRGNGEPVYGGTGQHCTTRAFGESWNTLYAGGGGGGGEGAAGGAGGGGTGGNFRIAPTNGVPNTGGGGGGGARDGWYSINSGGSGGSGICIVRWGY